MNDELKPCPFCGHRATNSYGVICSNDDCPNENRDSQGACFITAEEWNTRPIEDALQAENDRLNKLLRFRVCSCGWTGREFQTLDYKHRIGARMCPECHEPTEIDNCDIE